MTVTITSEIIELYLEALVQSGFYGFTKGDAVRRLICDQLQLLIKEKKFLFTALKEQP